MEEFGIVWLTWQMPSMHMSRLPGLQRVPSWTRAACWTISDVLTARQEREQAGVLLSVSGTQLYNLPYRIQFKSKQIIFDSIFGFLLARPVADILFGLLSHFLPGTVCCCNSGIAATGSPPFPDKAIDGNFPPPKKIKFAYFKSIWFDLNWFYLHVADLVADASLVDSAASDHVHAAAGLVSGSTVACPGTRSPFGPSGPLRLVRIPRLHKQKKKKKFHPEKDVGIITTQHPKRKKKGDWHSHPDFH